MRFIKRFIFVLILLVIAFFIYRRISPKAANNLLDDLKTLSNNTIGTNFSLSEQQTEDLTGVVMDITGAIVSDTGSLEEITGDDDLLLQDIPLVDESFDVTGTSSVTIPPTPTPTPTTTTTTTSTPKTTTTTKTTTNGLSSQDRRDTENILDSFGN